MVMSLYVSDGSGVCMWVGVVVVVVVVVPLYADIVVYMYVE